MRVPPFYSPLRGIALEEVWHDNDECPINQSVALADRIPGTGTSHQPGRFCALLDATLVARPNQGPPEGED